jgi:fructokinase
MKPVLCFGEILWDCLPRGLFLGGAPLNVAYHLRRQGARPYPISAVGNDFLGEEALRRVRGWTVETSGVALQFDAPTGVVQANLREDGSAAYEIKTGAAWDKIPRPDPLGDWTTAQAIVYGTLALRSPSNRLTLQKILEAVPGAFKVCDLNLREPYTEAAAVEMAVRVCDLLKVNQDELARLTPVGEATPEGWKSAAWHLAEKMGGKEMVVTAGAEGAGLWWKGVWHWCAGQPVEVRDTIGAGDAFLAALINGLILKQLEPAMVLRQACRLGEFVASQDGATSEY